MRSVLVLASGTGISQAILLFISFFLTRLYTPNDFGILGFYMAIVSIVSIIASLRYDMAIVIAAEKSMAINLLILSILLILGTFVAAILVCVPLLDHFFSSEIRRFWFLLPLGIIAESLYYPFSYWLIRGKQFKTIAVNRIIMSVTTAGVQLGLASFTLIPGLIVGRVTGGFSSIISIIPSLRENIKLIQKVNISTLKSAARRYINFSLLSSGAAVLNTIGGRLPVLMLAWGYGNAVVGWFVLCETILGAPSMLIGQSVGQVYLSEAAVLVSTDPKALLPLCIRTAKKMAMLAVIPCIIIATISKWLIPVIWGEPWIESGRYMQFLALMFMAQFIMLPIGQFSIIERQDLALLWNMARLFFVFIAFLVAKQTNMSALSAIGIYSVVLFLLYVLMFVMIVWAIKVKQLEFESRNKTA
jgi:O-antigen/teichoic acid export membrane protein